MRRTLVLFLALASCLSASPQKALPPITVPHNGPGFRSDSFPSPLDHFTLADKEGATQHLVIPFSPAAKHTIDVTVASGLAGGTAK